MANLSVSLGTDPPNKPQPSNFFWAPGTEEINKSPQADIKPDNSNVLYMFNNNTYTDFRVAYRRALILNWGLKAIFYF